MRSSRCEPLFSGEPPWRRRSGDVPPALRRSIRSTTSWALSHAASSVGAEDGPEGDLDPRRRLPSRSQRGGADGGDLLGRVGERLAPQAVDVGHGGAGLVGGRRRSPERDVRSRLLHREDIADEVLERVVASGVIERLARGPHLLDDLDVLARARVAVVLGEAVALAGLLVVVAAGDEVDGDAAVADLIDRGERLGRVRRDRQVRAVGQQQLQGLGARGDERSGGCGVRRTAAVREQDAIPAVLLVGLGQPQRVVLVEAGSGAGSGLRAVAGGGDAEELDGHGSLLRSVDGVGGQGEGVAGGPPACVQRATGGRSLALSVGHRAISSNPDQCSRHYD